MAGTITRSYQYIVYAVLALAAFSLFLWYTGQAKPLTQMEVQSYLQKISSQKQVPGGKHDLAKLQAFLEADDGKPFYTVNLYRFHKQANYIGGAEAQLSGREAYDKFSQVMIRLLLKQGSHPIFGTDWVDTNINGWDRLVIVRYRSRRDIAEVFSSDAFARASSHKWAALAVNERLVVQALHIAEWAGFLMLVVGLTVALSLKAIFKRRKNRSIGAQ